MGVNGEIQDSIEQIARKARNASQQLSITTTSQRNEVLNTTAELLIKRKEAIQVANDKDLAAGREKGLSEAMLDRLSLSDSVIESICTGIREVIGLADPIGAVSALKKRPNGLLVGRMRVPLGVIGMIYESRPNVTIDAAVLCLKTGNSIILRGGSEAIHSNIALTEILQDALAEHAISPDAVQIVSTTERGAIEALLQQEALVDLIIPRGGEGLIRFVAERSRIPVLKHYKGVCHIYVDRDADLDKAIPIILNSKVQRPGVCNALEGLLIHESIAPKFVPVIEKALGDSGVRIYGCDRSVSMGAEVTEARDEDWGTEFLDLRLCMKIVDSIDDAQRYISTYGSQHTEVIITENYSTANRFISSVDASAVMVNASTRFNDGGQLGLGTEIGISTTKLHAYGPMGLKELTTRKFVIYGSGQVRK